MSGVSDLSVLLQQALTTESETEVRFFVQNVAGLAWYHKTKAPLANMLAFIEEAKNQPAWKN